MIGHSHRLLQSPSQPTQCLLNFSCVEVHLLSFCGNLRNLEMQPSNLLCNVAQTAVQSHSQLRHTSPNKEASIGTCAYALSVPDPSPHEVGVAALLTPAPAKKL
jgi:hypothetical protein